MGKIRERKVRKKRQRRQDKAKKEIKVLKEKEYNNMEKKLLKRK